MTRKKIIATLAALAVGLGIVLAVVATGDDEGTAESIIIPRPVERKTLRDILSVNGTLRREEIRKINSPVDGRVSEVFVEDGEEVNEGDALFALDGRAAVAVRGEFSFFRSLDVGAVGPDVEQLERILADAGFNPGPVDRLFTEATRTALARWQLERGYGGATPEPEETITVSLSSNSAGYDIGKANTIATTIVPAVPTRRASATSGDHAATPAVMRGGAQVVPALATARPRSTPEKPTIQVSVSPTEVDEGGQIVFTFTSTPAPATDRTIQLTIGGSATGGTSATDADYTEIRTTFVFPGGQTTYQIPVTTFVDNVVEDDEDITVTLSTQFGNDPNYIVGPVNQARAVIRANGSELVPVITAKVDNDVVNEGQSATITLESTVELNRDLDIYVSSDGTATSGTDYVALDEKYTLTAGSTSLTFNVQARSDDAVEPDETVRVFVVPHPSGGTPPPYTVGNPSSVTVKIKSTDIPTLTIVGGGRVSEGSATSFTILASSPVVEDTSVNYQVSGSATPGVDYEALPGTVLMRAGTSSVTVTIRTFNDDVVFQPSDMIVAGWPARVGRVEVDEGEFLLQGSAVLTLTEPDFTVTLQLSPSNRAKLEVGLAVTVELEAGGQEVSGVITELDDNASVAADGTESYEGVVDVSEDLAAVDGARVSIDVTLDERVDVLAVPVAAVLRSGGASIVRVVDDRGRIERVEVEVGLVDNEFIEIVSGLDGDELVIVSVDSEAAANARGPGS